MIITYIRIKVNIEKVVDIVRMYVYTYKYSTTKSKGRIIEMNFREMRLRMINEVATRANKNEKKQNQFESYWISMFDGLIQDDEERGAMFFILFEEHIERGILSVYANLKKWIIANRELDMNCILEQIHSLESCNDISRLSKFVGEIFLEDIDVNYLKFFKLRMDKQGWIWKTLLNTYIKKQNQRVNRILNIPYENYIRRYLI